MKTANALVDINVRNNVVAVATMNRSENFETIYRDTGEVDPSKSDLANTVEVLANVLEGYINANMERVAVILKESVALRLIGAISEKHNPNHSTEVALARLMKPSWIQAQKDMYETAFSKFLNVWANLDYELVIVNARTLYRYQIAGKAEDLATLKSGDTIQLNAGKSVDGRFDVSGENSYLNGEYPVRVMSVRNPQTGAQKLEYFVERMITYYDEEGNKHRASSTEIAGQFDRETGAKSAQAHVINALKLRRDNIAQLPSTMAEVAKIKHVVDSNVAEG